MIRWSRSVMTALCGGPYGSGTGPGEAFETSGAIPIYAAGHSLPPVRHQPDGMGFGKMGFIGGAGR